MPSGDRVAPMNTCAPGVSIAGVPGSNVTTGASGGTIIARRSPFAATVNVRPSALATSLSIVALVIVLSGCRSQG